MKASPKRSEQTCSDGALSLRLMALVTVVSGLFAVTLRASPPEWWYSRGAVTPPQVTTNDGVVTTNLISNDYAVVNQGQLKQFTVKAAAELDAHFPGGAGTNLNNIISSWAADYQANGYNGTNPKPSDFEAMNVGQLKYIGNLVYSQFDRQGYRTLHPSWLQQNTNSDNGLANLGQLKELFNFDFSLAGPTNLTVTSVTDGSAVLNWTTPSGSAASAYLIEAQNSDGSWNLLTTLSESNTTSYTATNLASGQNYIFQVIATGGNSASLPSQISTGAVSLSGPQVAPASGRYNSPQTVVLSTTLPNSSIYYTTDGSDPAVDSASIGNGGLLSINSTTILKFVAIDNNGLSSPTTTAVYRITANGDLAAGDSFSAVLKSDGTVWTWGDNGRGQQGDNQANNPAAVPQQVPSLTGVQTIASAGDHALVGKTDGTVWAWGADDQSQNGDSGTVDSHVPTQISGLAGIAQVFAGPYQGFAVDGMGDLYAWGNNGYGQLGDGTVVGELVPEAITGMSNVTKIAAGPNHTLALKSDGTVWACGSNATGQLGDGTNTDSYTFHQVPGLANVIDIAAAGDSDGSGHSIALLSDGTVWAWGANWNGELGTGNFDSGSLTPEQLSLPSAVAVTAINGRSLILLGDGTVRGFGTNFEGELGTGNNQDQASPSAPPGVADVNLLSAGAYHTVACTTSGAFYGWGDNTSFKLTQDFSNFTRNTEVHDDGALGIVSVASSETASIALKGDGTVWAVGQGSGGLLGQGGNDWSSHERLIQISSLSNIRNVFGGEYTAFAIDSTGALWGWGNNGSGQLGIGNYNAQNSPNLVETLQNVVYVAGGDSHTLAVLSDGTVWAFGSDSNGQLGDSMTDSKSTPTEITTLPGVSALSAAAGFNTSFVLAGDGTVWAWGQNDSGQLGLGTTSDVLLPTPIAGLPTMIAINARYQEGIGIDVYGNVWGWGNLGNADGTPLQQTSLTSVLSVACGYYHGLAIKMDGTLWGWGAGWMGQLGNGSYNDEATPTQFSNVDGAVSAAGSYASTLLVKQDGSLSGFGRCIFGELGADLGSYVYSPKPLSGINLGTTTPSLAISAPASGSSSTFGTAIQFHTSVSSPAGSVVRVDYYLEGRMIGSTSTPGTWDYSYSPLSYGSYTFSAVGYNAQGVAQISAPVTVNVPYDSDNNGLADWWENRYLGATGNDPNSSLNGNGLTLLQDFQQGNDPTNYYSQGGTIITPTLSIQAGNNQTGPQAVFFSQPLVIKVTSSSGSLLVNAPVTFTNLSSTGGLALATGGAAFQNVSLITDATGTAQAFYAGMLADGATCSISFAAGPASANFTESTLPYHGTVADPTQVTSSPGANNGETNLTWINNASGATYFIVLKSVDKVYWTIIATINDPSVTSYTATGLDPSQSYYFGVIAGKPD